MEYELQLQLDRIEEQLSIITEALLEEEEQKEVQEDGTKEYEQE